ncbi:MAG: metal-sulfur cluster assembly factor [Bacteroidota bacterium]|nr:metal-sulfur cluster assembly factor [Bacteroidota bacterium]
MSMITNDPVQCERAHNVLKDVYDPEIGLNVVDLGLIYQIDFDEAIHSIYVRMTLTTQFCPMGESITDAVKRMLELSFDNTQVKIELVFDPPWNHEMISEEGKEFLNGE